MALSVLIIDDDPTFRAIARRVLSHPEVEVVGDAGTVFDGRSAADGLRPDAVLVDVGLPDGDGVALARELCGREWAPKVVVMSVDADATTDEAVRAHGGRGFLPKHELPGSVLPLLLAAS
jgi:DNA-binding NarL/FixJ family response regulator